ncbi:hypothetical protein HNP38_001845 [Chryseobacterium defluvii]|uniref:Uncharacterized protein n=1 Tax=Chryseobacterium defluvii TaxID=160396 RepID=A0A840KAW7_9FLAO|nr:hypothetical protein [Chryseobacterium defluvii]MBB4806549.1 hypothetical protein [Chryseobacterium defluvii]
MKKYIATLIGIIISGNIAAQVTIGAPSGDPSALLHVNVNDKGVLFPRLSTADRNLIATPAEGLMVYDTDVNTIYQYVSGSWEAVSNMKEPITRYYYAPGVAVTGGTNGSIDLYQVYQQQFSDASAMAVLHNPSAAGLVPYGSSDFNYFVTHTDGSLTNLAITSAGVLTYDSNTAPGSCAHINVLFVVK